MSSNRRRNAVVLPIATWAMWIVLATFISCAGLYYVYCKNQLHVRGEEEKALEQQLVQLQNSVEAVKSSVEKLSAPNALAVRREQDKTFLAGYVEIKQEHIVLVGDRILTPNPTELRAVANTTP
ncbi:MAG: hypothetical protein ACO1QR_11005 [Chthoniobacteraceae bacterium]